MTVIKEDSNDLDFIPHNKLIDGVAYKYGVPADNQSIQLILPKPEEPEKPQTPVERLMGMYGMDGQSSYESLVLHHSEKYRFDIDMYGEITEAPGRIEKYLAQGLPIPREVLKNNSYMTRLRLNTLYNPDIPGQMMDINPMKFVAS